MASLAATKNQPPPKLIMVFHVSPIMALGTSTLVKYCQRDKRNMRAISCCSRGIVRSE
jgi:hypothetical protein